MYLQLKEGTHGRTTTLTKPQAPCGGCPAVAGWTDQADRRTLLRTLSTHFGVRRAGAREAARAFVAAVDAGVDDGAGDDLLDRRMQRPLNDLTAAVTPVHAVLFAAIAQLPDGMEFILQMRADLQRFLEEPAADWALRPLDDALKAQLQAWFALGFLQLQRISWQTPALVLEKIMQYEAVHAIRSWAELKQRLVGPSRTCFGFFHPSLPSVPLVFVEVALTDGIATSIQAVLAQPPPAHAFAPDPPAPTTAVFYSISSTQPGLTGVELGNLLIKRVVHELRAQHPQLATFVTLSPLPGFMRWLRGRAGADADASPVLPAAHVAVLARLRPGLPPLRAVTDLLDGPWFGDAALAAALQPVVLHLGAHYLVREKKRKQALDPVANFHVRNGAWVWQLNWCADTSPKGVAQSASLMVNYRYVLEDIDANHQRYLADGEIPTSAAVRALLGADAAALPARP